MLLYSSLVPFSFKKTCIRTQTDVTLIEILTNHINTSTWTLENYFLNETLWLSTWINCMAILQITSD